MNIKKWSNEEETKLKQWYPLLGYTVCDMFPERTKASIIRKAELMNLKVNKKLRQELKEDRIGFLDIEASQLKADFGIVYSWYIKELGVNHYDSAVITREEILNGTLDKRVVQELVNALKSYSIIVTYYGTGFDIPFIRTRALMQNVDFIPYGEVQHKDMYFMARSLLCLHSKRLESVCDSLGIVGKTKIENKYWILANTGNKEALEYICEHNKGDVDILEKVYLRLSEFGAKISGRSL